MSNNFNAGQLTTLQNNAQKVFEEIIAALRQV